jgi:hypothetical protein
VLAAWGAFILEDEVEVEAVFSFEAFEVAVVELVWSATIFLHII